MGNIYESFGAFPGTLALAVEFAVLGDDKLGVGRVSVTMEPVGKVGTMRETMVPSLVKVDERHI